MQYFIEDTLSEAFAASVWEQQPKVAALLLQYMEEASVKVEDRQRILEAMRGEREEAIHRVMGELKELDLKATHWKLLGATNLLKLAGLDASSLFYRQ